jgi:hypothetical protein
MLPGECTIKTGEEKDGIFSLPKGRDEVFESLESQPLPGPLSISAW